MAKIIRQTLREQVTNKLRNKILTGELVPGTKIIETDLAEEFGVSRVPVREALLQIEQEGLVSYVSHVGCTVKNFTAQDVYEIYLLRGVLESLSVSMCDGQFSNSTIKKMEAILDKMTKVDSVERFDEIIENDNQFHECIVKECQLNRVYQKWKSMNSENTIVFYRAIGKTQRVVDNQYKIHKEIMDVIKQHNSKDIVNVIINHYLSTSRFYLNTLKIPFEDFPYKTRMEFK